MEKLTTIDKMDIICCLTGWLGGGALQSNADAEIPPLEWWEGMDLEFSENAQTIVGTATEEYTIPEMIDLIKAMASSL